MMKKLFIVLLAAFVFAIVHPTKSEAKVMYDGAEVVKGQTGKMTFKKDIKVYKKNPNGTFDSLMVKRNKFFRTYDIEKYDGKIFYQMGEYRVQATDLVVFKEVPIKIRSSFYNDPIYIHINRDNGMGSYGYYFLRHQLTFLDNGRVDHCFSDGDEGTYCDRYLSTDFKITEKIEREYGTRYEITKNAEGKGVPLKESKTEKIMEKGSIVYVKGLEMNGYLYVGLEGNDAPNIWLPVNVLKPVVDK
ncbi:hypothetical protein [Lysinibacillus sp. Bpr_S20]|uniref:hypothetical protein n=2 Tax=unclassified Lysinibacillus TaxID=2636778 RepID=UPI002010DC78|nr:hypothetical protein [Lysinibacillus sp. Bpr_S20]